MLCLLCFVVNICQTEFYCLYDERKVYKCILKEKMYRIKVLRMFLQFENYFSVILELSIALCVKIWRHRSVRFLVNYVLLVIAVVLYDR